MHDETSEEQDKPILIIPAAGRSSRFPDMKPKWMLTHPSGKLMIEKVIDGIDIHAYQQIYIVILKDHCIKHDADVVLNQAFSSEHIKVVVLDEPTESSPQTVYECIEREHISGWIVVKDCDCLVSFSVPNHKQFVVGLDIKKNPNTKNLAQKSFIVADDNQIIQEIVEKEIISNTICLGVYAMNVEDFVSTYRSIRLKMSSELYFSHVVSDLIDKNPKPFVVVYADRFEDWGTKEEWFSSSNLKNTYVFDIDGVLVENRGKYGVKNWFNSIEPIESNMAELKRLSDEGHEIVLMTSRTEDALILIRKLLSERQINYKTIVSGCLHSKRILVNDFAPSNPFPSCLAINIPRNEPIGPYLR